MSTQVPENMKDILDEITSYVYLTNFILPDRSNLGDHSLGYYSNLASLVF